MKQLAQFFSSTSSQQTTPDHLTPKIQIVEPENPSRRELIRAGVLSAGGLLLAFNLPFAQKSYAAEPKEAYPVQGWLQLNENGEVVLVVPVSEMGQGSQTALAMIFADELGADYDLIKVKTPLNNMALYRNPIIGIQVTGGSTAVRAWWQPLSEIAATLREMMTLHAAQKWNVEASKCFVRSHKVFHPDRRTFYSFNQLVKGLERITPPSQPKLKSPEEYRYIGQPMPRVDTPAKINGSAIFGMDVVLPNMLVATVAQSPVFGGEIDQYDEEAAMSVKGVKGVVEVPNGIAVVADNYWQAQQGLKKLKPTFSGGKTQALDTKRVEQRLKLGLRKPGETLKTSQQPNDFNNTLNAIYSVPYLAHTTMEPMNATAYVTDNQCEVWAPTQNQTQATQVAADISLMQPDQVVVHTTYLGGGFGRRANVDYVAQAVTLSVEMEAPVKVIWSRPEDIQHDFYRPGAVCEFKVKTDSDGYPIEWQTKVASDSVLASFTGGSATMIDDTMSEGLADQEYQLNNMGLTVVRENLQIPLGFWRSVGHSYTGFFLESMINELAQTARVDPFTYRKKLLKENSRTAKVLNRLESFSNWQFSSDNKLGKGMAVVHSFGSYVGEVVEAHIEGKKIIVDRVYCVVDCGRVVNPEIVKRQMSSAIIYGLTAALTGKIHFKDGAVVETNYDNYPMMSMAESPEIHVELIKSQEAAGGYGEPGLPPVAPALAAALAQLTGEHQRDMPFKV